jgi:hypothetical protein
VGAHDVIAAIDGRPAQDGRLDCACEQIAPDFPEAFDQAVAAKARETLERLSAAARRRRRAQ